MTLKVRISHASPGYGMTAIVQLARNDGTLIDSPDRAQLGDGESTELYVYDGQKVVVSEGPPRPVDIPVGESQTISPGDVGHASSLFGNLGGN